MPRSLLFLWLCLLTSHAFAVDTPPCPIPLNNASSTGKYPIACLPTIPSYWANILGWTQSLVSAQNLCGGYYDEPKAISAHPNPLPISEGQMNITSTGISTYSLNNNSTIEGNVILTQPGREIRANKVTLIPNQKTGQIDQIDLQGDVRFQEAGKLIVGKSSQIDMTKKTLVINQGGYHIVRPTSAENMNAWGTAKEAHRESPTFFWFKQATYTTCTPIDPTWYIKSKHITLNKNSGRGTAKNVVIYGKKTPFFYLPYISFPIDKRRYSGFLYPSVGYDKNSGAFLGIPYYFNIAPNYDDTLTVTPMSKRGVLVDNQFRYLTQKSNGSLEAGILPNDHVFEDFKQTQTQNYPVNSYNNPYLTALKNSNNNRGQITFYDRTILDSNWSASLDINYVTDDYYFQDLGSNLSTTTNDQLLNQAALAYQDEYWQFSGKTQIWQTLHPINQVFISDQYQRLPQLNVSTFRPNAALGMNYAFNGEWVYFDHVNDFFTGAPYPTGNRLHLYPEINLPFVNSAAFFIPALGLDITNYVVKNNAVVNVDFSPPTVIPNNDPNLKKVRTLPIFSADSGLYLDRYLRFGKYSYRQTLEPHLFYLYVPTTNQNNIPIFDTTLPPFGFDELFRTNRFMGYDRVGDANQLSLGLTSRSLDSYTGEEKINASIGAIYYFRKHRICLYPNCSADPTINNQVSPIAAQLSYHPTPTISITGNAAWNPNQSQINNDGLILRYTPEPRKIMGLSYNYIKNGDILNPSNIDSSKNNLHRLDLSIAWPLPGTTHWNILGDWNYNISHDHPQTYLYGLEYQSCCSAIRLIGSRVLQAENSADNVQLQSAYYIQFLLKSLGSVGNTGGASLLQNSIPNYVDTFK